MEQGDGERDASLLSAAQRLDVTIAGRQVQQFGQKLQLRVDKGGPQIVDATKILESLLDGEVAEQGQLLWHVANARAGHAALRSARLVAKDQYLAAVQAATANQTAEQSRFPAPAGSEQPVSVKEL